MPHHKLAQMARKGFGAVDEKLMVDEKAITLVKRW